MISGMSLRRELLELPNLLSLSRIPLGLAVWFAPANVPFVLGLMAVAAITDLLDGEVARRTGHEQESTGTWLDPLCDKLFIASVAVAVWVTQGPPWWLAAVASAREAAVALLLLLRLVVPSARGRRFPWRALVSGKATTVAQFALFFGVLLGARWAWPWLAGLAGALGVVAGVQYSVRALRALRSPPPRRGA